MKVPFTAVKSVKSMFPSTVKSPVIWTSLSNVEEPLTFNVLLIVEEPSNNVVPFTVKSVPTVANWAVVILLKSKSSVFWIKKLSIWFSAMFWFKIVWVAIFWEVTAPLANLSVLTAPGAINGSG